MNSDDRADKIADTFLRLLGGTCGVYHENGTLREILSEEFPSDGKALLIADKLMWVAEVILLKILQGLFGL